MATARFRMTEVFGSIEGMGFLWVAFGLMENGSAPSPALPRAVARERELARANSLSRETGEG
ncbi:hypothetical protein DSM21852_15360 [Methylocystis bryophila]|nr:hypothetical protein DSM21852_15360 [Methylocystis bryophila]